MNEKSNEERKDTPKNKEFVSFMIYNMPVKKREELIEFMRDKGFKDLAGLIVHMMEFQKAMDKIGLEVNKNGK